MFIQPKPKEKKKKKKRKKKEKKEKKNKKEKKEKKKKKKKKKKKMGCKKCGCSKFSWNPASALAAFANRWGVRPEGFEFEVSPSSASFKGKSVRVDETREAYRNCLCGHHYNYH